METKDKPYFDYSENSKKFKFQVHLVNPTTTNYIRVKKETGSHFFMDDELVTSKRVIKEMGCLPPKSTLLVDESDLGERDYTIWYNFDLYPEDNQKTERITHTLSSKRIRW
jgi:hypothetical protein